MDRVKRFWQQGGAQLPDRVLLTDPATVGYFTGFWCEPHERFVGLFLFRDREPALVVPALEREPAEATGLSVWAYRDDEGPEQAVRGAAGRGEGPLGVEKHALSLSWAEQLGEWLGVRRWVDVAPQVRRLRMIKDAREIEVLRQVAQLTDRVLEAALQHFRVGMTERDLADELEHQARRAGADGMAFSPLVLSAARSALPHGVPGAHPIEPGSFLLIDFGLRLGGYHSDITRTFVVGADDERMRRVYEAVQAAQEAALKAIRPGITCAELDRVARQVLDDAGYGPYFIHRLGHGVGLSVHEPPSVDGGNSAALEAEMVITVEPGVYVPGWGGVRIEDMCRVTERGAEVLTRYSKALTVLS
ncbi:MAG: Xaa-Pro peptidase family protein, partial [Calditerricola sp.]|nr:Xaa-Pro peptidase family protein [Calditerricola sp.]